MITLRVVIFSIFVGGTLGLRAHPIPTNLGFMPPQWLRVCNLPEGAKRRVVRRCRAFRKMTFMVNNSVAVEFLDQNGDLATSSLISHHFCQRNTLFVELLQKATTFVKSPSHVTTIEHHRIKKVAEPSNRSKFCWHVGQWPAATEFLEI